MFRDRVIWYEIGDVLIKVQPFNYLNMDIRRNFRKLNLGVLGMAVAILFACEGPIGPVGPPGQDGIDGENGFNFLGEVFELEGSFSQAGNFGIVGEYGFEILPSDKVLIYRLDFVDEDGFDVWRALPQTVYLTEGIFTYAYNFTTIDYSIFLESNFDLNGLETSWTDNQVFRVLILPADFTDARIDYTNHDALIEYLDINTDDIPRIRIE